MTLQKLQSDIMNAILNEHLDPNKTTVVFHDLETNRLIAIDRITISYNGTENTIYIQSVKSNKNN